MKLEEYKRLAAEQEDWAPGWEAIDSVFGKLYPNQNPAHYGTLFHSRAIFGGDEYLDGFSIYDSPKGFKHLLTYGMTELYTNEEAFGGKWSRWGYEMTIKLKEETNEDCMWAIDMLSNLAKYTFTQNRFFEPFQFIAGNGSSLHIGTDSNITALLVVNDTEAQSLNTVHGKVEFMQLVGITQRELEILMDNRTKAEVLVEEMRKDNPYLVTDMGRIDSYL